MRKARRGEAAVRARSCRGGHGRGLFSARPGDRLDGRPAFPDSITAMDKHQRLIEDLSTTGTGTMKCHGSSMLPILENPSTCTYRRQEAYAVGDIVFCKVNGRFIDAHKIVKIGADGRYLIANNRGHENGWTRTIFGRVVAASGATGTRTFP